MKQNTFTLTPQEKFLLLTEENQKMVISQIEKLIADQSEHQSPHDFPH